MQKQVFDPRSVGFFQSILLAIFSITALFGIQYPATPDELTGEIITTVSTSGYYALVGILLTSIIAPVYNFIKKGIKVTWANIFGSTVTWVSIGGIAIAGAALVGLQIDPDTPLAIVTAITGRDWGTLVSLLFTSVLLPVIRWIKQKQTDQSEAKKTHPTYQRE